MNSDKREAEGTRRDGYGDYKRLLVWQKAMLLVREVYELTASFPKEERYGLISQMRRAAVSVPSNIAEGQARHTSGEFAQFLSQAQGSLAELDTQLILSVELTLCNAGQADRALNTILELRKMLNALQVRIAARRRSVSVSAIR